MRIQEDNRTPDFSLQSWLLGRNSLTLFSDKDIMLGKDV
jgi:hypothetical protein